MATEIVDFKRNADTEGYKFSNLNGKFSFSVIVFG